MKFGSSCAQIVFPALAVVFLLAGCAVKGPIQLTVGYTGGPETKPSAAAVVGVSPFRDIRGTGMSIVGKRTIPDGQTNDLIVQGTAADAVTSALKQALAARGFAVKTVPEWDLTAEGMKAEGTGLLFGGEIKTLWLESTATSLKTHVKATVGIRFVAGDPAEKKIIKTLDVHSNFEEDVLYSRSRLEAALSEALSNAIDQVFRDEELKKKLR
jgi:uncharacterized lipoprotein YajG